MKKYYAVFIVMLLFPLPSYAFDHEHREWTGLLRAFVIEKNDGNASSVYYEGFRQETRSFQAYLTLLSAVTLAEYEIWTKNEQKAFLVNAYNAFTIDLILTRYPDLESIKDIGGFLSSPWKKEFFILLGEKHSLDWIEHEMLRKPGAFDDPRIHFAVNCASIGCPMLRKEAFTAEKIDSQLDDAVSRFLSDRQRNRFDTEKSELVVSSIFDWYGNDFEGGRRYRSLKAFFAGYADILAADKRSRDIIRQGRFTISFADYDWRLNSEKFHVK